MLRRQGRFPLLAARITLLLFAAVALRIDTLPGAEPPSAPNFAFHLCRQHNLHPVIFSPPVSTNPTALPAPIDELEMASDHSAEPADITPIEETPAASPELAQITIIIDDLGYQWAQAKRLAQIPGALTFAVLPASPYSKKVAQLAHSQGKELMLHAPMEPLAAKAWNGGLNAEMAREELQNALMAMLADVPGAVGVNNHMGSALTQHPDAMTWVMETLATQGLYFVDSRTSPASLALQVAQAHHLPSVERDVFLDNQRTPEAIALQLQKLVRIARKRSFAIAIGHPYPETIAALETFVAELDSLGVELVPMSKLIPKANVFYAKQMDSERQPKAAASIKASSVYSKPI